MDSVTSKEGYTYNFDIYGGKKDDIHEIAKGLSYEVVVHLVKTLKNKAYDLFFNHFFTSIHLAEDLLKSGNCCCKPKKYAYRNRRFKSKEFS